MKIYSFADIKARPEPTINDINNPWIFGNVMCVINVSEHESKFIEEYDKRKIKYYYFPLKENISDIGYCNIIAAVKVVISNIRNGIPTIVHCTCGNNRSRSVVEAAYFALYHKHLQDEYKGFPNHLIWNIKNHYLPYSLDEFEHQLINL